MPSYKAPVDDTLFLLNEVLNFQRFGNLPGFADVTPDVMSQILLEAGKICEEALAPLNQIGDEKGWVAPCWSERSSVPLNWVPHM